MWNGGRGHEEDGKEDPDDRIRAALAAYAAGSGNVDQSFGYNIPAAQFAQAANPMLYQSQEVESLRRQEEMQLRQQALYSVQQQHAMHHHRGLHELEYARLLQEHQLAGQQHQLAGQQHLVGRQQLAEREQFVEQHRRETLAAKQQEGMERYESDISAPQGDTHAPVKGTPCEDQFKETEREDENFQTLQVTFETQPEGPQNRTAEAPEPGMRMIQVPRGKPEAMAAAIAAARIRKEMEEVEETIATAVPVADDAMVEVQAQAEVAVAAATPPKKKPPKKKKSTPSRDRNSTKKQLTPSGPTFDDPVPPITEVEYENVITLMEQFCKVPLLAEFSRPVAQLHPELFPKYSKIVSHPMDLGRVCRFIRRRQYKNTRAIQLDMWRIFANCIKYHTCPYNKDNSVPSFVSIALHLREYFNALWQEYLVPSDPSAGKKTPGQSDSVFGKREKDRKNRIATTTATMLSARCLEKTSEAIRGFVETGGRVDKLDFDPIFGDDDDTEDDADTKEVVENLRQLQSRLTTIAQNDEEYTVDDLDRDIKRCYMGDLFESRPSLRIRVGHRIDRLIGKIIVNVFEANSRGVNQSSIWGCMAAAIWARESSKKPYWPALVLGIMAPEEQKEEWHTALTERNERRLPEKLRMELEAGKRKAEHAIRRQNAGTAEQMSYFLVEFMGTHEFIWVKESDMIETFDPDSDPNQSVAAGNVTKKKRSSRSNDIFGSKTFISALDEGKWALEEFELQLNDTCGDLVEDEEDDEEANYSYAVLCQSDDEVDEGDGARDSDVEGEEERTMSEIEEANELLTSDGLLDFSVAGRKNARKKAIEMKRKKADADKAHRKEKLDRSKRSPKSHSKKSSKSSRGAEKENEEKRAEYELDKRRKKRSRERERVLKEESRMKKPRLSGGKVSVGKPNVIADKKGRASAIVKSYLMKMVETEDLKSLGLAGVLTTMPASHLDSTGLLGMALAFRAAAGELGMPDSGDPLSKLKPWEAVDVDSPDTAKERESNLLKRKELLEVEIKRIKADIKQRKELTEAAIQERLRMEEEVTEHDKAARTNHIKKKKKTVKSETRVEDTESSPRNETDETGENAMEIDDVLSNEIEAAPSSKLHSQELVNREPNFEVEIVAKEAEDPPGSKTELGAVRTLINSIKEDIDSRFSAWETDPLAFMKK